MIINKPFALKVVAKGRLFNNYLAITFELQLLRTFCPGVIANLRVIAEFGELQK